MGLGDKIAGCRWAARHPPWMVSHPPSRAPARNPAGAATSPGDAHRPCRLGGYHYGAKSHASLKSDFRHGTARTGSLRADDGGRPPESAA